MASEHSAVRGLEPRACWRHFEELTKIARPSRHEEAVIEHVRGWAADRQFELRQDAARNLVVRVPAAAGRGSASTVILQGHLDMVCERRPDSPNDPAEGRIALVRDGDWLTADGTTLGADNGIGIAAMMALAEDESFPHGPLELLMTVIEEVGGPGEGASGLDPCLVTGTTLLNLDSEEDGKLTVGSASSTDTEIRVEPPRAPCTAGTMSLSVSVSGGLGGHSGTDIAHGRSNAIKVLARTLREALAVAPFRLVSLAGGRSWNAIPRDATAICSLLPEREGAFRAAVETAAAAIRDAYAKTDPGVTVAVTGEAEAAQAWTERGTRTVLDLVAIVPSGPLAMSPDFGRLVETSTSVGAAVTRGTTFTLHSLSRSSNPSALPDVIATLDAAARVVGACSPWGRPTPDGHPTLTRGRSLSPTVSTSGSSGRLRSSRPCMPGSRPPSSATEFPAWTWSPSVHRSKRRTRPTSA
jgi:dipeptidase D